MQYQHNWQYAVGVMTRRSECLHFQQYCHAVSAATASFIMPPKRRLPADESDDEGSTDVREIFRAVARAFNQVLGDRSEIGQLALDGSESAADRANRLSHHDHEHRHGVPAVVGAMGHSSVPIRYPHIPHQHPSIAPVLAPINHQDADEDDIAVAVPVRITWSRCTQCHRCHDPSRRCRCYACGAVHDAGLPCAMSIANAQRCHICNRAHAPGPCSADAGPLAARCEQCGRYHLPTTRCRCRLCGALHVTSAACNNDRAPITQDLHVGAAFSRQPVAAYDCGDPTETCPHCAALFFVGEAPYLNCCRKGTITVQQPTVPPPPPTPLSASQHLTCYAVNRYLPH